jgi:recombination protein RecT
MAQNNGALASKEKLTTLQLYLKKSLPAINAVLPKHLTGERLIRIVGAAASRQPELLECTPLSIAQAVVASSQLGLEPVGSLGHAYLVPFSNGRNGQREAQLIIGYRGLIDLARRSGNIASIEAHVIHERDAFDVCYGLESKIEHRPYMGSDDPGSIVAAYAIARFKDGTVQTEIMTIKEILAIRDRAKASKFGPWVSDFDEMARKTVVKRLCKYLPLSAELADAVAVDNAAEAGTDQLAVMDMDVPEGLDAIDIPAVSADRKSKTEEVAALLDVRQNL